MSGVVLANAKNILLVDDELTNLRVLNIALKRKYKIFKATSATDALEILQTHKIDLIISDHAMPHITGLDFLSIVKQKYPEIGRILCTAYIDNDNLQTALTNCDVYDLIEKPVGHKKLIQSIEGRLSMPKSFCLHSRRGYTCENSTKCGQSQYLSE